MFRKYLLLVLCAGVLLSPVLAQAPKKNNSGELELALNKLTVLGSVLYIAAHPDDENTRLISWLANDQLIRTGYLSLTRGDGGQNLIGPEAGEQLGLIRTQELLQARRVDGGTQFFTRANDFGFSKHPDETFKIWDREAILADVVWVIRKFRPDVIITRFSTEPGTTHGHHTASAMLALEAFEAAGDPNRFPEQLAYVQPWKPTRILWNTSSFFFAADKKFDESNKLKIDVGTYSPLLGKSYTEVAAESRSMHKSQGFGSAGVRGTTYEYFEHYKGPKAEKSLLEGIDTSWKRIKGGAAIEKELRKVQQKFNPSQPSASVNGLLTVLEMIEKLPDNTWKEIKANELKQVIKACMGLYLEAAAKDFTVATGQKTTLNIEAINRSEVPLVLNSVQYSLSKTDTTLQKTLAANNGLSYSTKLTIPADAATSQPYWLTKPHSLGMFTVDEQQLIGLPENEPTAHVRFNFTLQGKLISYTVPVVHKKTDPVDGEVYRPFAIIPSVLVRTPEKVLVFANSAPKIITALVQAGKDNVSGDLKLNLPAGWRAEPATAPFVLKNKGEELTLVFKIYPSQQASEGKLTLAATTAEGVFTNSVVTISYPHIPAQMLLPEAETKLVRLDLQKKGQTVGYLAGAGDEIPASLREIGYQVTMLSEKELNAASLKKYDAVILGVRAFNTLDKIKTYQPKLMEYVREGGTVITQYNTSNGLNSTEFGPYPITLSRDRVTVEQAEVRVLAPEHPLFNTPNKITAADFENWVQERGLYFPSAWGKEYTALLSSNDPGESPKDGGLLVAKYGKGYYIYTSYAWFRQLPAGVPGAYRLFTNLISIGK